MSVIAGSWSPTPGTADGRALVERMLEAARPGSWRPRILQTTAGSVGVASSGSGPGAWVAEFRHCLVGIVGSVDVVGDHERIDTTGWDPARLVAELIVKRGLQALETVRGDFAVVVVTDDFLAAARDHLGSVPLFAGRIGPSRLVATQPKQILSASARPRTPHLEAIERVYFGRLEADEEIPAMVEGVDRVPRAAWVRWHHSGSDRGRVWDLDAVSGDTPPTTVPDALERLESLLETVVRRHLGGHDAVALSGGIDSTLIAAFAAPEHLELFCRPLAAVSAVYPHAPSVDESAHIAVVAEHLGIDSTVYVPAFRPLEDLTAWVDHLDAPSFGVALPAMEELLVQAKAGGATTVLGGEMAELVYDLREHLFGRLIMGGRLSTAARHARDYRAKGLSARSLIRIAGAGMLPSGLALTYQRHRRDATPDIPDWFDPSAFSGIGRRWDLEQPAHGRWEAIQRYFAGGPSITGLEASWIADSRVGVSTRRPLVDRDLWQYFLSLPPHVKFPDGHTKSLVRRLLDDRLPASVVRRPDKTVFNEDALSRVDWEALANWIFGVDFRLNGIRYDRLKRRLELRDLSMWELTMARSLASIHAFVISS